MSSGSIIIGVLDFPHDLCACGQASTTTHVCFAKAPLCMQCGKAPAGVTHVCPPLGDQEGR